MHGKYRQGITYTSQIHYEIIHYEINKFTDTNKKGIFGKMNKKHERHICIKHKFKDTNKKGIFGTMNKKHERRYFTDDNGIF